MTISKYSIITEKPYNLTVCRTCSKFCYNGSRYCSLECKTRMTCIMCHEYKKMYGNKCQYCDTSLFKKFNNKVRCITCQRRCTSNYQKSNLYNSSAYSRYEPDQFNTNKYCSLRCSNAPLCICNQKVWLDFGENYSEYCLECIWKTSSHLPTSDVMYGRPNIICVILKYDDKILVHKRGLNMTSPGHIAINSGHVEPQDKSSYDAVRRELMEEASIDISSLEGSITRLSKPLYCIELTYKDYLLLTSNISNGLLKPSAGFEYEVDMNWGYRFVKRYDITLCTYDTLPVSKFLHKSIKVHDRYYSYVSKSSQSYKQIQTHPHKQIQIPIHKQTQYMLRSDVNTFDVTNTHDMYISFKNLCNVFADYKKEVKQSWINMKIPYCCPKTLTLNRHPFVSRHQLGANVC